MTANHTVVIIQNNHSYATEFLIIVSQTVFFIMIFLVLKSALIDKRGMMYSYDRIMDEKLQLGAIFFAIFVFLALLMIPMHSYEFVHYVVPLTYLIIFGLLFWEFSVVYQKRHDKLPTRSFHVPKKPPIVNTARPVVSDVDTDSVPGTFVGSRTSTAFDY